MQKTKIIFMGTPNFACKILKGLIKNYDVTLVVTQPDKYVGRKKELTPSPIKELAILHNIEVFQPEKIKEDYKKILNKEADIIITCAYGQIIPKVLLDYPPLGCINVHASLLPRLRGGAPIHKALIDGYEETGITIMYMDEKMDTGDMIAWEKYSIKPCDNVGTLHDKLSDIGKKLLLDTLPDIINGTNNRIKQNENDATYAYNIKREEERLNFNDTSINIYNKVRGLNPWPLANILVNEEEIKVIECYYELTDAKESSIITDIKKDAIGISTKDGIIYITKIKPFGKKEMLVSDYLNGINKNDILGKKVM